MTIAQAIERGIPFLRRPHWKNKTYYIDVHNIGRELIDKENHSDWIEYIPGAPNTVTIDKSLYVRLLNESGILAHLMAYGVDNWEGYEQAIGEHTLIKEEDIE